MRSPFKFARRGQCGTWVSDAMPHLAGCVDDITVIRSMFTTNLTHELLAKRYGERILDRLREVGASVTFSVRVRPEKKGAA